MNFRSLCNLTSIKKKLCFPFQSSLFTSNNYYGNCFAASVEQLFLFIYLFLNSNYSYEQLFHETKRKS